ncbi:hypothetical protein BGZ54_007271, partial [Gamsiella multidivaricata]
DTSLGFPMLKRFNVTTGHLNNTRPGTLYNLKYAKPVVLTRLGSHSPDATIRIFNETGGFVGFMTSKDGGPAFGAAGRNKNVDSTTGQLDVNQYTWDGLVLPAEDTTLAPIQLPPMSDVAAGNARYYRIVVASQKKLTKGNYPEDFEIFDLGMVGFDTGKVSAPI